MKQKHLVGLIGLVLIFFVFGNNNPYSYLISGIWFGLVWFGFVLGIEFEKHYK